jgi:hypothetical protein
MTLNITSIKSSLSNYDFAFLPFTFFTGFTEGQVKHAQQLAKAENVPTNWRT